MGCPKPLLGYGDAGGRTFVAHLVGVGRAAGVPALSDIYVIGRPEDAQLQAEVARQDATFVPNLRAHEGQLSSLQAGLSAAQAARGAELEGVIVIPVDMPLIGPGSLARLVHAASRSPASILRATHEGRHGHPVLFKRAVFAELYAADAAVGARAVVRADPARVENVEVGDAGATIDFDTPEDYLSAFGRRPDERPC